MTDTQIIRVDWSDARAVALRAAMDEEMGARYADRHPHLSDEQQAARARAFVIDPATMTAAFLAVVPDAGGAAVAHAALRRLETPAGPEWELKRVITLPSHRGKGLSTAVIAAVEAEARRQGAHRLVLQTGDRQPEAIALYRKLGYTEIPGYPPYAGVVLESLYFGKEL